MLIIPRSVAVSVSTLYPLQYISPSSLLGQNKNWNVVVSSILTASRSAFVRSPFLSRFHRHPLPPYRLLRRRRDTYIVGAGNYPSRSVQSHPPAPVPSVTLLAPPLEHPRPGRTARSSIQGARCPRLDHRDRPGLGRRHRGRSVRHSRWRKGCGTRGLSRLRTLWSGSRARVRDSLP